MTPPQLCRCSHPRSLHDGSSPLIPCKPSCGCLEWRPVIQPRDENTTGEAA